MSRITFVQAPRKNHALILRNPVFKSMGRSPMDHAKQTDLALAARIAFESVQRGTYTEADRDTLACIANVCMVLAEWHCSPSDLTAIVASQEAMLRADGRTLDGKRWNFDGEGRTAMLAALDIHEQLIAQLGQTAVTEALMEIIKRRTQGQVHRVELAS
jgi:hypothetical protein